MGEVKAREVGAVDMMCYLFTPGRAKAWFETEADEFKIMQTHTTLGAATLEAVHSQYPSGAFIKTGIEIAKHHHEKWNGAGYPDGLSGTAIPLSARIMSLVDVYDALRARRPYKEPFSHEKSRSIIMEGSGTGFDPQLVEIFAQIHQKFDAKYNALADK